MSKLGREEVALTARRVALHRREGYEWWQHVVCLVDGREIVNDCKWQVINARLRGRVAFHSTLQWFGLCLFGLLGRLGKGPCCTLETKAGGNHKQKPRRLQSVFQAPIFARMCTKPQVSFSFLYLDIILALAVAKNRLLGHGDNHLQLVITYRDLLVLACVPTLGNRGCRV